MTPIHSYNSLEHFDQNLKNWFVINWCMGNTCNFECSYCPAYLHNGTTKWHTLDRVKNLITAVKQAQPEKHIYAEFTGGEVTLHKDFIQICKFCNESNVKIGFISNGSRSHRWWLENQEYFNRIMLSYHVDQIAADHFYNTVKILHNNEHIHLHVNIMMHPEKWNDCMVMAHKLKELGNFSIALQPLLHNLATDLYPYTSEQRQTLVNQHDIISKHIKWTKNIDIQRGAMKAVNDDGSYQLRTAHSFISRNTNNWQGWQCFAGVEQMVIDMDGNIYRGWCKAGGPIGHLNNIANYKQVAPIICNQDRCHCNFDIMCTKIRKFTEDLYVNK